MPSGFSPNICRSKLRVPRTTTFKDVLEQVQHDSADFQNWQDSFSWSNAGLPLGLEQGPELPIAFDFAEIPDTQVLGET